VCFVRTMSASSRRHHTGHTARPPRCCLARGFEDRFSALVVSHTESEVLGLLSMLTGEKVTGAPEGMKERAKFVTCALDSYQKTTTWSTCLKAFRVTGLHPVCPELVLGRPDVRQCDNDRG
jgi:hypothetical protein